MPRSLDDARLEALTTHLRRAAVEVPGDLDGAIRRAALSGEPVPPELQSYADKMREHPYRVVDEDVEALLAAGLSEDAVFELTVAIAVGEGLRRLDAGLGALAEYRAAEEVP